MKRTFLNYIIDIGLIVSFMMSFTTAIIKFPGFLPKIGVNPASVPIYQISVIHDWSGIAMGVLVMVHLVLHWKWIVAMTKRTLPKKAIAIVPVVVIVFVVLLVLFTKSETPQPPVEGEDSLFKPPEESSIFGEVTKTDITMTGKIIIDEVGEFEFNPANVETIRKDIFKEGHFSVFAVLVHLDSQGDIDMDYHFDESADTYVIDSLNDRSDWWYMAHYSGGWSERNVYRMDFYPYKDKMYVRLMRSNKKMIESVYSRFKEEVERKKRSNGRIIIPSVIIKGETIDLRFDNVEVTAHNLRNDVFQEGVITAIDVILSLGDEGRLSYDLQWYSAIGTAEIVKSYWVSRINEDTSHGRCGFVYEAGAFDYQGFRGNHIHIPADFRVIVSPEYVEFFWICL